MRRCPSCGTEYSDPRIGFCKQDGAPLGIAGGDPLIGRVMAGRYLVHQELGRGGMGTVYAAEHVAMRRRVALKVVRAELANDPVIAARFVREARLVSRLEAQEIVQVFDSGADDGGRLFLAMELLVGKTLRERIAEAPLPIREALDITAAVLRALTAAHGGGVVHRDLKPDNIFLCDDGRVKVLDFGIARVFSAEHDEASTPSVTATGAIVGTALYMSPEAVSREVVGPPADLYALGAIVFEMLTGAPPFEDAHPVLVMGMHLRLPPPRLADRAAGPWARELEGLVSRMLAKAPGDRPTASEIAHDVAVLTRLDPGRLEPAQPAPVQLARAPIEPAAVDGTRRIVEAPRPRRRSWPAAIALAAVLGSLGVGAWVGVGALRSPDEPTPPAADVAPDITQPVLPTPAPSAQVPEPALVPPPAPATMALRGRFDPSSAWAELDGARVELPQTLEADGSEHTLVVSADGYASVTRTFTAEANRDQVYDISLRRLRAAPPPRARPEPTFSAPTPRSVPVPAPLPPPAPRGPGTGLSRDYTF